MKADAGGALRSLPGQAAIAPLRAAGGRGEPASIGPPDASAAVGGRLQVAMPHPGAEAFEQALLRHDARRHDAGRGSSMPLQGPAAPLPIADRPPAPANSARSGEGAGATPPVASGVCVTRGVDGRGQHAPMPAGHARGPTPPTDPAQDPALPAGEPTVVEAAASRGGGDAPPRRDPTDRPLRPREPRPRHPIATSNASTPANSGGAPPLAASAGPTPSTAPAARVATTSPRRATPSEADDRDTASGAAPTWTPAWPAAAAPTPSEPFVPPSSRGGIDPVSPTQQAQRLEAALVVDPSGPHADGGRAFEVTLREPRGVSIELTATATVPRPTHPGDPAGWSVGITASNLNRSALHGHSGRLDERLRSRGLSGRAEVRFEFHDDDEDDATA